MRRGKKKGVDHSTIWGKEGWKGCLHPTLFSFYIDQYWIVCLRACSGMSFWRSSGSTPFSSACSNRPMLLGHDKIIRWKRSKDEQITSQEWKTQDAGSSPWGLKLNKGGRGRPDGNRVAGLRSSSKKGWTHASSWMGFEGVEGDTKNQTCEKEHDQN